MEQGFLSEYLGVVNGLAPDADALAGTVTTDVIDMGLAQKVMFALMRGTGSTGTQTITLQASAANDGSSPTAIAFRYRRINLGGSPVDSLGELTEVTSAGFTTAAGGSDIYLIEAKAEDLPEAKNWLHLKSVEVVDAAVDAGILILVDGVKYLGANKPSLV